MRCEKVVSILDKMQMPVSCLSSVICLCAFIILLKENDIIFAVLSLIFFAATFAIAFGAVYQWCDDKKYR